MKLSFPFTIHRNIRHIFEFSNRLVLPGILMPKTGVSECYFVNLNHRGVERLIEMVKSYLKETSLPPGYDINIYPSMIPLSSIVLEIMGPDEEEIKALHLRLTSKILEICERRGIESHGFEPLKIS